MFWRPRIGPLNSHLNVLSKFKSTELKHKWTAPEGYDTGIKVYSRKEKKNLPLILINKHYVKWYICGPTVYDVSHIGHASCYIRFDMINRILREFFNINPVVALGITDIDDKIIKISLRKKVDFKFVARQFEFEFFENLNQLNILPPVFILRVSEHIPEIISFISKIIEKGNAYATEDGSVYFINPEPSEDSESYSRNLKPGQRCPSDFALWKGNKPEEPYFESPWGKGRPGWHIECSAMASKVFGSNLDLHGGGCDLIFPHHSCEEIQSCSYHGCDQWVNYWLHTGELQVMEQKMSKSLNNFISISEFLKSYSADVFRMYCFQSSYTNALHYGPDSMSLPASSCNIISKFLADTTSYVRGSWKHGNVSESDLLKELEDTKNSVREHLMNNFDTSKCQIVLMSLIKKTIRMLSEVTDVASSRSPAAVAAVSDYVRSVYQACGFRLGADKMGQREEQKLEFVMNQIVKFRLQVRAEAIQSEEKSLKGNLLNACDSLREDLKSIGIIIKDQGRDKASWSKLENEQTTAKAAV